MDCTTDLEMIYIFNFRGYFKYPSTLANQHPPLVYGMLYVGSDENMEFSSTLSARKPS